MSVVFQLFCADDLVKLSASQLDELKTTVGRAIKFSPSVLETVKSRADEVYEQLTDRTPTPHLVSSNHSQGMLGQMFDSEDLKALDGQQVDVLKMAIECAITHSPEALQAVKEEVDPLYVAYTGEEPKESDVYYGNI